MHEKDSIYLSRYSYFRAGYARAIPNYLGWGVGLYEGNWYAQTVAVFDAACMHGGKRHACLGQRRR